MSKTILHSTLSVFAATLGAASGYVDLRVEAVQLPAMLVLASAFLMGVVSPHLIWRWTFIIGLSVPVTVGVGLLTHWQSPADVAWLPLIAFPMLFAFLGACFGAIARKGLETTLGWNNASVEGLSQ